MRMKSKILLVFLLLSTTLLAQQVELPRGYSQEELAALKWQTFVSTPPTMAIEAPPPYPVRHMAEWEELQALAITWRAYPDILTQIVRHAAEEVRVVIFCNTETVKNNAQLALTTAGVNLSNVDFVVEPNNSVWIRDYGPNCVYENDVESLNFIDWVYNRITRPEDDAVPNAAALHFGVPIYSTTANPDRLVNTGGNFMSDGLGSAFASKLILEENEPGNAFGAGPHTESAIDQIMQNYMGIDRYIKMETLPFDAIHHIDMHMRLLDEETLLVGEYPAGISDGPQIEANLQYVLDNFMTPFGTPYKVVRVVQPPDFNGTFPPMGDYRTYTNSVFVNKTIIIPAYEQEYDTIAMRVYRENFPGYKVVNINCNDMIGASGALHCITKEIGAANPLLIVHQRLADELENDLVPGYTVDADIQHKTGIESATVFYTIDTTQAYSAVPMQPSGTGNGWTAMIPHQPNGSKVFYYISATANDTKTQVRPLAAPAGYYEFTVSQLVSNTNEPTSAAMKPIFPNPASSLTAVPVKATNVCEAEIELTDIYGRSVLNIFAGKLTAGETRHYFDAAQLSSGIYFVTLRTPAGFATQKLVVK
jgi:agmatine/peptidylarginine deiminase